MCLWPDLQFSERRCCSRGEGVQAKDERDDGLMIGVIVSGGNVDVTYLKRRLILLGANIVYGVDKGLEALDEANVVPNWILGDFDSCRPETLEKFKGMGVPVLTYPAEKDMTDTHLAIEKAIEDGVKRLYIFGWNGSRMDHTMGSILIAEKYLKDIHIVFIDPNNRIFVTSNGAVIEKGDYKYVSLLPLSDKVTGVTAKGFKYPLDRQDLSRTDSYGISNELESEIGHVFFDKGVLCIVQSKD